MSRSIYSSLDDAFQPLNPQQQKNFHSQRVTQEQQVQRMWEKEACNRDFSEIHDRMSQGYELPPYCAKENNQFREFQRKSNQDRENYLKNMDKSPRAQLSNDYQDVELGMYKLRNSPEDTQSLVAVKNNNQKAHLQKRLEELERELKKYQFLLRVFDEENANSKYMKIMNGEEELGEETIESFSNLNYKSKESAKDDIIDLIVLLGIGLLIIFVLDSVFKMGKGFQKK
jgi:hypothetical protein